MMLQVQKLRLCCREYHQSWHVVCACSCTSCPTQWAVVTKHSLAGFYCWSSLVTAPLKPCQGFESTYNWQQLSIRAVIDSSMRLSGACGAGCQRVPHMVTMCVLGTNIQCNSVTESLLPVGGGDSLPVATCQVPQQLTSSTVTQ